MFYVFFMLFLTTVVGINPVLAGTISLISVLAAGISAESENKVKVGGTMTANPLSTLAGITVLRELENKNVHEELDKVSRYFMKGLEDITERYDVPALLFHHSSILHVDVSGLQHVQYFVDEKVFREYE